MIIEEETSEAEARKARCTYVGTGLPTSCELTVLPSMKPMLQACGKRHVEKRLLSEHASIRSCTIQPRKYRQLYSPTVCLNELECARLIVEPAQCTKWYQPAIKGLHDGKRTRTTCHDTIENAAFFQHLPTLLLLRSGRHVVAGPH